MDEIRCKVDRAIDKFVNDFRRYPNKYLTEEDVRVHLCLLLMSDFGEIERTRDNDCSISLHAEVRWWGAQKRKDRSDIVIFDVSDLTVTHKVVRHQYRARLIPKKGYSSSKPLAIIELKLRRGFEYSNAKFVELIQEDYDKLFYIKEMLQEGYQVNPIIRAVALDKREAISQNVLSNMNQEILRYCFSNTCSGESIS